MCVLCTEYCPTTPETEEKGKESHESRCHIWLLISMHDDSHVNTHLQAIPEHSLCSHNHLSL